MKTKISLLVVLVTALIFSAFGATTAFAATRVRGYTSPKTHKYVAPYYRSGADSTRVNNYSTKGNVNPYTGKKGTKPLYSAPKIKKHY